MQNSDMADHFAEAQKPHAVCLPFPAQGHINAILKLAILLHHRGFFITLVNTERNHRRLLKSRGPNSVNGLQDFQFETIPDGLPPTDDDDDADSTQDIPALCDATRKHFFSPVSRTSAATEIGVPGLSFRPTNGHTLMCCKQMRRLIEKGILPLKDITDLTLDTTIDWIPTLENIPLKDFPTHIRITDVNDLVFNFVLEQTEKSLEASAIIFNTFDALEGDVLDALSPTCPPIYTLGPLHLFCKHLPPKNSLKSIEANLWKEEPQCLQWLDSKQDKSVVYVNFGSITVITPQQLVEFAWGLANSNKNFLWIIRSNSVVGDDDFTTLLNDFLEETKERGLIARWCPQEEVLNHPSIAAFLTHCGWNSVMESLASGVPMICWPFFADQRLNCRCASTKWGVGVEINSNVNRDEVEKLVRDLIDGEECGNIRNKAFEWKEKAEAAIVTDGSSYLNLDKLMSEILKNKV